jgi:RNA polymerase sigma-70 factor (ECF subfamily)
VLLEEEQSMQIEAHDMSPLARMQNREAVAAARQAILRLRDAEKEVFLLRTSAGLSFDAIGKALQIPIGTAKTRMRSALLRLRESLAAHAPALERGTELP